MKTHISIRAISYCFGIQTSLVVIFSHFVRTRRSGLARLGIAQRRRPPWRQQNLDKLPANKRALLVARLKEVLSEEWKWNEHKYPKQFHEIVQVYFSLFFFQT